MKWKLYRVTTFSMAVLALAGSMAPAWAATTPPLMATPLGLSFLQVKITGDEFIVLQNNTGVAISDLGSYWLTAYNNVNPLASGVSSSNQQLPAASLAAGQTLLLSANPMSTCSAAVAGKLSLSLSDSGGFLQIGKATITSGGSVVNQPGDSLSWSSGAAGQVPNLPSNTKDPMAVLYRYQNGVSYPWQLADLEATNFCQLNVMVAGGTAPSAAVTPLTLPAASPPATIIESGTSSPTDTSQTNLPAADVGLMAPQLSELLPNPAGSGNDSTNEFIELYNPNDQVFDLSGFSMRVGTTTQHSFIFPAGLTIEPLSFRAFYAYQTKLSLSNSGSQVLLLDPSGAVLASAQYGTAQDGLAWALAAGIWYWTIQPTPDAANVIRQLPATPKATASAAPKKATIKKAAAPKSSKTAKAKTKSTKTKKLKTAKLTTASSAAHKTVITPIHWWPLALVGAGALLYALYEYRGDLANGLFKLRSHFKFGRSPRAPAEGGRGD